MALCPQATIPIERCNWGLLSTATPYSVSKAHFTCLWNDDKDDGRDGIARYGINIKWYYGIKE